MSENTTSGVSLRQKILILITAASIASPIVFIRGAVATALPNLMTQYGSMPYYSLVLILYTISTAISPPIAGKLADVLGRRTLCLISAIGYMAGLAGCAFAQSFPVFLASYLVLGIFFGAMFSMPQAVMGDVIPVAERPKYFSYMLSIQGIFTMLSSLFAGYIIDAVGPNYVFLAMLPLLVVTLCFIAKNVSNERTAKTRKIDYLGIFLLVITLVPIMIMINFVGSRLAPTDPITIIGIIYSIVMAVLLYKHEIKTEEPILVFSFFSRKRFCVAAALTACIAAILPINQNYLSLFSQGLMGLNATTASLLTLPRSVGTIVLPSFFGIYAAKKAGNFRKSFIFCSIVAIPASAVLLIMNPNNVELMFLLACFFCALGLAGCGNYPVAAYAQRDLERNEYGAAAGTLTSIGTIAGSLIGAIIGAVLNSHWNLDKLIPADLKAVLTPAQLSQLSSNQILKTPAKLDAIQATLSPEAQVLFTEMVANMKEAMQGAMTGVAIVGIVFGVAQVLISIFAMDREDKGGTK